MTFIQNYFPKINLNNLSKIPFRSTPMPENPFVTENYYNDSFVSNPLQENISDAQRIESLVKSNPRIMELLNKYNIPLKVNMEELSKLQKGHLAHTRLVAAQLYSGLPDNLKKEVDLSNLQEAAMLHDYGKIFIPQEILNKKGALTPEEKEIMELHSELGYEILKSLGVNSEVLRLVKYHHQKSDGSGYPKAEKDFDYDLSLKILSTADKYTALTEKDRPYRNALSKEDAIQILATEEENDSDIVNALEKI